MALNVPTSHPTIDLPQYASGQDIDDDDILAIIGADARRYAWHGTRAHQVIYDPAFQTTSTTLTTASGSGSTYAEDLDQRWGAVLPYRPTQDDADEYYILVSGFLLQLTVEVKIYNNTASTLLDTITITNSGSTYAHATGVLNPTVDGFLFSGRDDGYVTVEAKATSGTGKLQQLSIVEGFLTASDLPKRQ